MKFYINAIKGLEAGYFEKVQGEYDINTWKEKWELLKLSIEFIFNPMLLEFRIGTKNFFKDEQDSKAWE